MEQKRVNLVLKPEKSKLTAFEEAINQARELAIKELSKAKSLEDFMLLTNAARNLTPEHMKWAEPGPDEKMRSAEEWFIYFKNERLVKQFQEEANILKGLLEKLPPHEREDTIQMLVSKVKGTEGEWDQYRLLGNIPQSVGGLYDFRRMNQIGSEIIYTRLTTACCNQAARKVLEGGDIRIIETDLKDITEFAVDLHFDPNAVKQNFQYRDEKGNEIGHRNENSYLYFALMGGFSNEYQRYRISDFPLLERSKNS